jgi:hypothetical protein
MNGVAERCAGWNQRLIYQVLSRTEVLEEDFGGGFGV